MSMKIKKRKTRRKKPEVPEPREIMGMGHNLEEGMRAAVMGDGDNVEVLYIIRQNRGDNDQGAYPLDQLSMSYFLNFCGLLAENAELVPEVDAQIREEAAPEGVIRLVSCGPEGGLRMWGAIEPDDQFRIVIGTTFNGALGEVFTRGDLRACAAAINEAFGNSWAPSQLALAAESVKRA